MSIQARLRQIQSQIERIAGDRPVQIVAVSKYATLNQMVEAYEAGIRDFGENKVQDALAKMDALSEKIGNDIRWHFIGSLQTNKVNKTLGCFAWLHTVDSLRLANALSNANQAKGLRQSVLIQVNSTSDPARHGVKLDELRALLEQSRRLPGIDVRGLMTMAPAEASLNGDQARLQSAFCGLRNMRDQLATELDMELPELSMGMSHDYVHALECGATIIRIGNVLFKN